MGINRQAKPRLTVYHRVGCHLCDEMIDALRALQSELDSKLDSKLDFEFELVDIDKDPVLRQRYDVDVPVVTRDGEVVCFHFFEEDMVRQALQHG